MNDFLIEQTEEGTRVYTSWEGQGPAPLGADYILVTPDGGIKLILGMAQYPQVAFNWAAALNIARAIEGAVEIAKEVATYEIAEP